MTISTYVGEALGDAVLDVLDGDVVKALAWEVEGDGGETLARDGNGNHGCW